MKSTKTILIGDTLSGSEAALLRKLVSAFPEPGTLFLANFYVGPQQIDFLVVTPTHAGLLEHKQFSGPVFGERNGRWELTDAAGNRVPHSGSSNPYSQVLKEAYALSDAMKAYRRKHPTVPDAPGGQFFRNFNAYVAIAPAIHPDSTVTSGDNKARVLSADDAIDRIRTTGHVSSWSPEDWYDFAIAHLDLRPVSLAEAIEPRTLEAANTLDQYRQRSKSLIGTNLPPLLAAASNEIYGATLVQRLLDVPNALLVGPSGSTKTFHLHHAVMAMLEGDVDIPIIVEAKRYRGGDFWTFMRQCLATVFPGDPKPLIAAAKLTDTRPVLFIDGLNECSTEHHEELLKGAIAFALQYDARTIITAQSPLSIGGLAVELLTLALPSDDQKRAIYAFHANVPSSDGLDSLCGSFRNAYELTIAGRCHTKGRPPVTALELYDRYVADCLPSQSPTIAGALARHLAAVMGDRGSLHLTCNDCESSASRFLSEQGAPLTVLDDLLHSPLLNASGGVVTFEHELLFKYLRASALQRSVASVSDLCAALCLPRNRELLELILPRIAIRDEVDAILQVCDDVSVLERAYDGVLGSLARTSVLEACDAFARKAITELETLDVYFQMTPTNDGRSRLTDTELRGTADLSSFEAIIAELIAFKDGDVPGKTRLLALVDRVEARLSEIVFRGAQQTRIGQRQAWSEVIRLYVGCMRSKQPRSTLVLSNLKHRLSGIRPRRPLNGELRESLLLRALVEPAKAIALYLLLEDVEARRDDGELLFTLVERAWATQIHFLQMSALFALTNTKAAIDAAGSALQARVAGFLETIESSNGILSSMIVEAQAHFETIEAPVSIDDALTQMRGLIDGHLREHISDADLSQMAYGTLSLIFEDVYQGAYFHAYRDLTDDERLRLLDLAADTSKAGSNGSWIMHELRMLDRVEALPAFRKAATTVDLSSPFTQDAIAVFIIAIYGYSRYAEAPPLRPVAKTTLERAWYTIGDALFWAFHDEGRHATNRGSRLLENLDDAMLPAAAAVLSDLHNSHWQTSMGDKAMPTIENVYPDATRRIATAALRRRAEIRELYRRFGRDTVVEFLVTTLADIGDTEAIPTLRDAMSDASLGQAAIKAIQAIEARSLSGTTSVK